MTSVANTSETFLGIDVAKDKFDLAVDGQADVVTFANDAVGIALLIQRLGPMRPRLIVVEATGGYERAILHAALEASLPIARVQPGRVRHFAKAQGLLAKNDGIDAHLLAIYARCLQPAVTEKRSQNQRELNDLLVLRRQLIDSRTAHTNQLKMADSDFVHKTLAKLLRQIHDRIKQVEKRIARLIDSDDDLAGARSALIGSRRRQNHRRNIGRSASGAGEDRSLPDQRPGWRCALRPRFRKMERKAIHFCRPRRGSQRSIHGHDYGDPMQPDDSPLCRATEKGRKDAQSRHYGVHAEVTDNSQRHGPRQHHMESKMPSSKSLTNNTAAPCLRGKNSPLNLYTTFKNFYTSLRKRRPTAMKYSLIFLALTSLALFACSQSVSHIPDLTSPQPSASVPHSTLIVKVDQPTTRISPTIYGLMTEEINHSYDGGLYAELIQNRIFKDVPVTRNAAPSTGPTSTLNHWTLIKDGTADGAISLDETNPVNTTALTTSLKLDINSADSSSRVGFANDGYWGIPVWPNTEYTARFYAKAIQRIRRPDHTRHRKQRRPNHLRHRNS